MCTTLVEFNLNSLGGGEEGEEGGGGKDSLHERSNLEVFLLELE